MDVVKLDKTTFRPTGDPIEGFSAKIWTERFHSNGDFEFHTPKIAKNKALIPPGSLISLMDSDIVQIVESHTISRNDEGVADLVIKGTTFETFLKKRFLRGLYQVPWQIPFDMTVQDVLGLMIFATVVNLSTDELTGSPINHNPDDVIPTAIVSQTISVAEIAPPDVDNPDFADLQTGQSWWMETGELYKQLTDILAIGKIGLRTIRPKSDGSIFLANVDGSSSITMETLVDLGAINKFPTDDIESLRFDIYNGRDRSVNTQVFHGDDPPLTPVIFRYDAGHIESPNYLFTDVDYRNVCLVTSSIGDVEVSRDQIREVVDGFHIIVDPSGLDRFDMIVDGGVIDDSIAYDDFLNGLTQKGLAALKAARRSKLLDGAISAHAPQKYKTDYFLGDLITVIGEYDLVETMQVSEFIRTEDENGEVGYPTLVVPE